MSDSEGKNLIIIISVIFWVILLCTKDISYHIVGLHVHRVPTMNCVFCYVDDIHIPVQEYEKFCINFQEASLDFHIEVRHIF